MKLKDWLRWYRDYSHAKRKAAFFGAGVFVGGRLNAARGAVSIGDGVMMMGLTVTGIGKLSIGPHAVLGPGVYVITSNHDYLSTTCLPYSAGSVRKDVSIGTAAWLGANVMLLPGTKIGDGAIIQAGSVVHGEIPRCAIAGGNPAKVFAIRDVETFDRLTQAGAYAEWESAYVRGGC